MESSRIESCYTENSHMQSINTKPMYLQLYTHTHTTIPHKLKVDQDS